MSGRERPNGLTWLSPTLATTPNGLTLARVNGTVDVYDEYGVPLVCAAATVEKALEALNSGAGLEVAA